MPIKANGINETQKVWFVKIVSVKDTDFFLF